MITKKDLSNLNEDELAYLYFCCDKEFTKNGYVYFDFDLIKVFPKQCIVDIVHKYSDTLSEARRCLPCKIVEKLENCY